MLLIFFLRTIFFFRLFLPVFSSFSSIVSSSLFSSFFSRSEFSSCDIVLLEEERLTIVTTCEDYPTKRKSVFLLLSIQLSKSGQHPLCAVTEILVQYVILVLIAAFINHIIGSMLYVLVEESRSEIAIVHVFKYSLIVAIFIFNY